MRQAGRGRLKVFEHNQALCFLLYLGPGCQSSSSRHFVTLQVALSGLAYPKTGALYFNLCSVYLLWKLFLLKLEEPGACSSSMTDLLDIRTRRRDTPQSSVTRYQNKTVFRALCFNIPALPAPPRSPHPPHTDYNHPYRTLSDLLFPERYFLRCCSRVFQSEKPVTVLEMISDCLTRSREDCSSHFFNTGHLQLSFKREEAGLGRQTRSS